MFWPLPSERLLTMPSWQAGDARLLKEHARVAVMTLDALRADGSGTDASVCLTKCGGRSALAQSTPLQLAAAAGFVGVLSEMLAVIRSRGMLGSVATGTAR